MGELLIKIYSELFSVSEKEFFISSKQNAIRDGVDYGLKIKELLKNSDFYLILLSDEYFESEFCLMEFGYIYFSAEHERYNEKTTIFSINLKKELKDCNLPYLIRVNNSMIHDDLKEKFFHDEVISMLEYAFDKRIDKLRHNNFIENATSRIEEELIQLYPETSNLKKPKLQHQNTNAINNQIIMKSDNELIQNMDLILNVDIDKI
ncbi:toll/interleukin-1 receptor domain-containing protein [Fusibacter paucivorans]|uniref:Toll/interleukin-1 receptor domain-containing protein n=1 Tax=Fusibacter paucivorans TaxID=76009 RepID=A0ABS5PVV8_9FIRM|nr:toll/interleukin-1 receptor domain-containing protein [Fusibacter paucivorans]MBS7528709.1 toll/interleukin-1 receptor domain-containing protein [Fusibacter paucivorans]